MKLSDYIFIKGSEHEEESIQRDPDRDYCKAVANGQTVVQITSEHGICEATFCNWWQRYGGFRIKNG